MKPELAGLAVVIESNADTTTVMAVILSDDSLRMKLPEASVVITGGGDQVRGVGTEGTVPDPALVAGESALELEWNWRRWFAAGNGHHLVEILDLPDLGGMVGRAGREVLDIWREQDTRNVLAVSLEVSNRDQGGLLTILLKMPDEDVALGVVRSFDAT